MSSHNLHSSTRVGISSLCSRVRWARARRWDLLIQHSQNVVSLSPRRLQQRQQCNAWQQRLSQQQRHAWQQRPTLRQLHAWRQHPTRQQRHTQQQRPAWQQNHARQPRLDQQQRHAWLSRLS